MPKLELAAVPEVCRTSYPAPFAEAVARRHVRRLSAAAGLKDFGVNLCRLEPGASSSQRHWHTAEDEFVWVVAGEATLGTSAGETPLHQGECAAFPAGDGDGHQLVNRSGHDVLFLVVGTSKADDVVHYPDVDLHLPGKAQGFTHKDGTPFTPPPKR